MNLEAGRRIKAVHISKAGAPVCAGETGTVWRVTQTGYASGYLGQRCQM